MPDQGAGATAPVILIVGWSGSGKTTLLERLVRELSGRGLRLGTVKHDTHGFAMDQVGKDTWRHQQAGAVVTAISSPDRFGLIERRPQGERRLEDILPLLSDVDLVLVEGYKRSPFPKIEVVSPDTVEPPACLDDPQLLAVVGDVPPASVAAGGGPSATAPGDGAAPFVPRFSRDDVTAIAGLILEKTGLAGKSPDKQVLHDRA